MIIRIIGAVIGAMILGAGIYYLKNEEDKEAKRIYRLISVAGGIIFIVMLVLTILAFTASYR